MRILLALVLISAFYTSTDSVSSRYQQHQHKSPIQLGPLLKLEREEILNGQRDASEGEAASIRNDPDTAAQKFGIGAERIEAAKNDAEVENTSLAQMRTEREHRIAQKLERLAEDNREDSALQAEEEKKGTKKKQRYSNTGGMDATEVSWGKKKKGKKPKKGKKSKKEKKAKKSKNTYFLTDNPPSHEEAEITGTAGWGADITQPDKPKSEEQKEAEGLPTNATSTASDGAKEQPKTF